MPRKPRDNPTNPDGSPFEPYLVWRGRRVPRCQAMNKNAHQCGRPARDGYTVCSKHGAGNRKRPGGRPPKADSRYSRLLPRGIAEKYLKAVGDPVLLEQRAEIALVQARLEEQLGTLDEAPVAMEYLGKAFLGLREAFDNGGRKEQAKALEALELAFEAARGVQETWRDVRSLVQERRVLVESERKRLVEQQLSISVEELLVLVAQIRRIILENVADPLSRSRITTQMRELMGRKMEA